MIRKYQKWRSGPRIVNGIILLCMTSILFSGCRPGRQSDSSEPKTVSAEVMEEVFQEVSTPYKYGVVYKHPDPGKMIDSPTIFRADGKWYMTYIVFDGRGYETWLAESDNLLGWKEKGRILSFSENTWDANQKAGYVALVNTEWGGSYDVQMHNDLYWMSYLGGATEGYEAGKLGVGMANTTDIATPSEWNILTEPVLLPDDGDARWFETDKIYKSSIIFDEDRLTGYPFVMYYNAKGDTARFESIGMAVSDDMVTWKRRGEDPVITRRKGICGDAQIVKMKGLYVMFYFGAFWKEGAFERFACSYDLVNWTDWQGEDLIAPSENFDSTYAHKPWVIKWEDTVYHFYNAVGSEGRVIALATSRDLKKEVRK
jgi:predicted GH43/DUF377 family glycosyl hydrolase